jgi:hypothetical protein
MRRILFFVVGGAGANLFVILLEGGQILAGLKELTLFRIAYAFIRVRWSLA